MNFKLVLYKAMKAAAVGAGVAFAAGLKAGIPGDKAAVLTLGVSIGAGALHALWNVVEQAYFPHLLGG